MAFRAGVLSPRALVARAPRVLVANVVARVLALVALSLATLLIARIGGPAAVGIYALLRVIPSLVGVILSAGLPGAVTYFLAGPTRDDRRLPLTICATALGGGLLGVAAWSLATPVLGHTLLPGLSTPLILLAGGTVLTQLLVATAKSCSQGSDDLPGANIVIVNEELMFLPAYGALWLAGIRGNDAVVAALLLADVGAFGPAWIRLVRRGFFRDAAPPSLALGRRLCGYGMRGQVGGVMTLLNLRLDFIILSVMAGPAVLGVYAIASKFAEFLKVPALALTYVLYPAHARLGAAAAAAKARTQMRTAGVAIAAAAVPLWIASGFLIPAIYGHEFNAAVAPARIIVAGLVLEGVAGVISAYLYGIGRPGLNSLGMAAGLAITVVLDFSLIPFFGAKGAAVASAAAYISSTLALMWLFRRTARDTPQQHKGGDVTLRIADLHARVEQLHENITELKEAAGARAP
jgi:O-antigen/teichoic acid export membrane protein